MLKTVFQAGEYDILEANWMLSGGKTFDVRSQIENIIVYEDIYKPFTTATIIMIDTFDLPGEIGRFSRDLFKIKIRTPGLPDNTHMNFVFFIDSIDRRHMRRDRLQSYCLNLVQKEYVESLHKTISKTFSGTGDGIVEKIVKDYLLTDLPLITESSTKQIKYTSNFWSPIKNIEYCKQHSINGKQVPLYFFFNCREGFKFVSLDKLINQKPYQTFYGSDFMSLKNEQEGSPAFGESRREPNKDWQVVQETLWEKHFTYTNMHQASAFKSDLTTHDLLTKKYKVVRWQGDKDPRTRLNPRLGYVEDVYATAGATRITASKYYDSHDMADVTNTKFIQKYQTELAEILQYKVQIDVLGRTDYTVGQRVKLDMNRPIHIDKTGMDIRDYLLSGDYLITAISHQFGAAGHVATIELSKESTIAVRLPQ